MDPADPAVCAGSGPLGETISACDPSGGFMVARGSNATMVTSDGGGSISACDPGGTTEADVGSGQLGTISA